MAYGRLRAEPLPLTHFECIRTTTSGLVSGIGAVQLNRQSRNRGRNDRAGYKGVAVLFDSAEEAARVYDQIARMIHGEPANIEFPDIWYNLT
jgi:hypothetical protein